jgi:hypothetical protein
MDKELFSFPGLFFNGVDPPIAAGLVPGHLAEILCVFVNGFAVPS